MIKLKEEKISKRKWELEEFDRSVEGYTSFIVRDEDGIALTKFIATEENYEEIKEIVCLIKTAPELLETAKNLLDTLYQNNDIEWENIEEYERLTKVIKKAKGDDE